MKATKFTWSCCSPMIGVPDQCLGCTVLCKSNESEFSQNCNNFYLGLSKRFYVGELTTIDSSEALIIPVLPYVFPLYLEPVAAETS